MVHDERDVMVLAVKIERPKKNAFKVRESVQMNEYRWMDILKSNKGTVKVGGIMLVLSLDSVSVVTMVTSGTSTSWSGDSPPSSLVFLFLLFRTLWMKFL